MRIGTFLLISGVVFTFVGGIQSFKKEGQEGTVVAYGLPAIKDFLENRDLQMECIEEYQANINEDSLLFEDEDEDEDEVELSDMGLLLNKALEKCERETYTRILPNLIKTGIETVYIDVKAVVPYEITKRALLKDIKNAERCSDTLKPLTKICPSLFNAKLKGCSSFHTTAFSVC